VNQEKTQEIPEKGSENPRAWREGDRKEGLQRQQFGPSAPKTKWVGNKSKRKVLQSSKWRKDECVCVYVCACNVCDENKMRNL